MSLISSIIALVVSLTGILFGIILGFIAPEELRSGKKYFVFAKSTLFIVLFLMINYFLYHSNQLVVLSVFSILAVVLFVLNIALKKRFIELFNYIIFVVPYFFLKVETNQLILASALFIYGLVAGTLLKKFLNQN
jgi:hypothetical protein